MTSWIKKLPVTYKGRTQNGWHRYYAERPWPDQYGLEHTVHIDPSRLRAWYWAWATYLCRRFLDREI